MWGDCNTEGSWLGRTAGAGGAAGYETAGGEQLLCASHVLYMCIYYYHNYCYFSLFLFISVNSFIFFCCCCLFVFPQPMSSTPFFSDSPPHPSGKGTGNEGLCVVQPPAVLNHNREKSCVSGIVKVICHSHFFFPRETGHCMRGNRLCSSKGSKCEHLLCVGNAFTGFHTVSQACDMLPQTWTGQDSECQMWESWNTKKHYLQLWETTGEKRQNENWEK